MTLYNFLQSHETLDNLPTQAILENLNYGRAEDDGEPIPDLDTFLELTQPIGNAKRAGTNNLYGINHRGLKSPIPENRDVYGLTFFTRPQLNFTSSNIRRNRKFYPLLNTDPVSVHRYVRCMLDPRLGQNLNWNWQNEFEKDAKTDMQKRRLIEDVYKQNIVYCPLVDPNLGFIPLLTNNLLSLSGWPDIALSSYTSEQGHKREQWIMADSAYEYLEAFNLTAVFRNTRDEPILLLFQMWELYMAQVFEGMLMPYLDMVTNNEMDYNTRIYRFILDETKRFVKKSAACGAAFPLNVPTGKMFDYSDEETYNRSIKEVDISFQCVGADYNDYATINEFNWVTAIFNPNMRQVVYNRKNLKNGYGYNMVKIPRSFLPLLNHRGYPYVNPYTLEMEWWISTKSKDLNKILTYLSDRIMNYSIFGKGDT